MEYLKLFENHSQYEDFIQSEDFIRPNVSHCIEQEEVHYNPIIHDYSKDYLTFIALENNTSFGFEFNYHMSNFELSYSLDDGSTWNIFENQENNAVTINKGKKILWKGHVVSSTEVLTALRRVSAILNIGNFISTGQFDAMGNIMSLAYSDDFADNNQLLSQNNNYFEFLFANNNNIINAKNLILPATTLVNYCYANMFENCTSLISAPKLSATTLAEGCYQFMFYGCTSLLEAPELPATTLANYCYSDMFRDCASLTTSPELLATTLVNYCYNYMFYGCTNLNLVTCLATDISASNCTNGWLNGVAASGTFIEDCYANFSEGVNGIPENWEVVDTGECPK